jgi:hypothetical protein
MTGNKERAVTKTTTTTTTTTTTKTGTSAKILQIKLNFSIPRADGEWRYRSFLCGLWGLEALCGVKFEDDNNNDYDDEHEHEHEYEHEHENTANKVECCNPGFLIL